MQTMRIQTNFFSGCMNTKRNFYLHFDFLKFKNLRHALPAGGNRFSLIFKPLNKKVLFDNDLRFNYQYSLLSKHSLLSLN